MRAAEKKEEVEALQRRYDEAMHQLVSRSAETVASEFETAAAASKAVIARPFGELQRLAQSDRELYATYYELVDAGVRIPADKGWDLIRVLADEALFHGYKHHIRFAALTLNEDGLPYYGDCYFVLLNEMIAHRTSVFECNSVEWVKKQGIKIGEADNLPAGYRAPWSKRGQLAIAKLGEKLEPTTPTDTFPTLLLQPSVPPVEEDFIEAHIWGPITIRTIEKVKAAPAKTKKDAKSRAVILEAVEETLHKNGITSVTIEV